MSKDIPNSNLIDECDKLYDDLRQARSFDPRVWWRKFYKNTIILVFFLYPVLANANSHDMINKSGDEHNHLKPLNTCLSYPLSTNKMDNPFPGGNVISSWGRSIGTDVSADVTADGERTTASTVPVRLAEHVSIKDFGAFGDAKSHPIRELTFFNNTPVSGWTLAQWQTKYPFIRSVDDETDQVAFFAALMKLAPTGRPLYLPSGNYIFNASYSYTMGCSDIIRVIGDGDSTRIAINGAITAININGPTFTPSGNAGLIFFSTLNSYQLQPIVGGTFLKIQQNPRVTSAPLPNYYSDHVTYGDRMAAIGRGTTGAFSPAVDLSLVSNATFMRGACFGWLKTGIGYAANGRNGTCIRNNGTSSSNLSFGPTLDGFTLTNVDIGVTIGNGTNGYVQGVRLVNSALVASNQAVKWYAGKDDGADELLVQNNDMQPYDYGIDTKNVLTVQIENNYFLGTYSAAGFIRYRSDLNKPNQLKVSGNTITAYGLALKGIYIGTNGGQDSVEITDNSFFDFNKTGAVPIQIARGTRHAVVSNNQFQDSNFSVDNGLYTLWVSNTQTNSDGTNAFIFATGAPFHAAGATARGEQKTIVIDRNPHAVQSRYAVAQSEGKTVNIPNYVGWVDFVGANQVLSFTTILPANPVDGQEISFSTTHRIITWELKGNKGQNIMNVPLTLTPNAIITLRWRQATASWVPVNSQLTTLSVPFSASALTATSGGIQGIGMGPVNLVHGFYLGWNYMSHKETDYINGSDSAPGGFAWFNANTRTWSSSPHSSIMKLSPEGILSTSGGHLLTGLTKAAILRLRNPSEGMIVNDITDHVPVIYEDRKWYPLALGAPLSR